MTRQSNRAYLPKRFKKLIEATQNDVGIIPNRAMITFSVCGVTESSCGWHGWILENLYRGKLHQEEQVEIDDRLKCPKCDHPLFRSGVTLCFNLNHRTTKRLMAEMDKINCVPITYVGKIAGAKKKFKRRTRAGTRSRPIS